MTHSVAEPAVAAGAGTVAKGELGAVGGVLSPEHPKRISDIKIATANLMLSSSPAIGWHIHL